MSDRFESYETTLRQTLTDSKSALTAKGVEVPETTKLRNVPSLIDGIQVGHSGNAITINCKDEAFIGETLTAKHTDGTTVTKVIDSLTAIIEIPKDGEWTVTNSKTSEQFKFTFDTERDLYAFVAYLTINFSNSFTKWSQIAWIRYFDIISPGGDLKRTIISTEADNYAAAAETMNTLTFSNILLDAQGQWKVKGYNVQNPDYSAFTVTKTVNANTAGQKLSLSFAIGINHVLSDSAGEQPSFGDEESNQTKYQIPKIYGINSTGMSIEQIEEIFTEIDNMIEQNKSNDEINAYISSKEQEYGQA